MVPSISHSLAHPSQVISPGREKRQSGKTKQNKNGACCAWRSWRWASAAAATAAAMAASAPACGGWSQRKAGGWYLGVLGALWVRGWRGLGFWGGLWGFRGFWGVLGLGGFVFCLFLFWEVLWVLLGFGGGGLWQSLLKTENPQNTAVNPPSDHPESSCKSTLGQLRQMLQAIVSSAEALFVGPRLWGPCFELFSGPALANPPKLCPKPNAVKPLAVFGTCSSPQLHQCPLVDEKGCPLTTCNRFRWVLQNLTSQHEFRNPGVK